MIKAVIFDVDGVIIDSMPAWRHCGRNYLRSIGVEAGDDLGLILFPLTMEECANYLNKEFSLNKSNSEIIDGLTEQVRTAYEKEVELKPGIIEFLEELEKRGIRKGVATSTGMELIEPAFDRLNINKYFDIKLSCTQVGKSKSFPDIFYMNMDAMGSNTKNTCLIEDGLYSMKTAKQIGMKVIGVYDEVSEADQEEIKEVSDIYVDDTGKLFELFADGIFDGE